MLNDEAGWFVARGVAERLSCSGNDNDHGDIDDEVTVHGEVLPRVGVDLLAHYLGKGTRENISVFIVAFPASPQMLSVSDEASSTVAVVSNGKKVQAANNEDDTAAVGALADE